MYSYHHHCISSHLVRATGAWKDRTVTDVGDAEDRKSRDIRRFVHTIYIVLGVARSAGLAGRQAAGIFI